MTLNPRGSFSADLSLFGSRITDIQPSDLPSGVSPDNENVWYQPGMVTTRPRFTRILPNTLAGNPDILCVKEFVSPSGDLFTTFLDSNGVWYTNDPAAPSVNNIVGQVVAGMRAKWENAFNKLWGAFFSPLVSAKFAASPFVGAGIPLYYNGTNVFRVTSDAPGITPSFINVATTQQALGGASATGTLTVTSAQTITPITIQLPPVFKNGRWQPGGSETTWTQVLYTTSTAVPTGWLGQSVTTTGFSGTGANIFNSTGTVVSVSGNTYTIARSSTQNLLNTGASASVTVGTTTYMQRLGNIVTVWLGGASLPSYFQPGYWAAVLNLGGGIINGPNWTITSISRDTNGLVTVTISTQLTNLPVGAELYLTPGATALSGTVSVTNGDPTVSWVSGSMFLDDMVGQAITINSVVYTVNAVLSPTSLQLSSNVTSATGTYSYSASVVTFPTGLQTVFQVTATTPTSTTFTYESDDTSVATATSGTVYQQWSPQLGTNGNEAQILSAGIDANNGAFFTFFQLGPDISIAAGQGNISSPYAQIQGQIPPGLRNVAMTFESSDGAETAPSPIEQINVLGGSYLLQATNILIGPPGTVSRNFLFTPYNGSSWYELAPATLPAIGNSGETIVLGTIVEDNTSSAFTLDFSDNQLTDGLQVDQPGNDLFNQIVLPPCLGVAEYGERLHWWGAINNVRNLVNMGFDGGYFAPMGTISVTNNNAAASYVSGSPFFGVMPGDTIIIGGTPYAILTVPNSTSLTIVPNFAGTTGTYPFSILDVGLQVPPGWTAGATAPVLAQPLGAGSGYSCAFSGTASMSQPVFRDEFGAPIVLPNTAYGIRFQNYLELNSVTALFTVTISSPTAGILATATFNQLELNTTNPNGEWNYFPLFSAMPSQIPSDAVLTLQANMGASVLTIDELELIFSDQPVQYQSTISSYVSDPFGYDDLTGTIAIDAAESITALFQQRGYLYLLCDESLFKTQQNSQSEPEGWPVSQYAEACGGSGPNAVDAAEDVTFWSGRYGGRLFNGNPETKKVTQEIASDWEDHNWDLQTLDWVANDPVERVVYFGYVQAGQTSVSAVEPMNYRLADSAYNVPDPVHVSTYSGKMIATDLGRKWSLWSPGMNGAAMCTRNGPNGLARQMVFAGSGFGQLYMLDMVNFPGLMDTDDDYGVIGGYYVSYFFPDHLTEQNPLVQNYRKFFGFLGVHATGKGQLVLTAYSDTLGNPSPAFPAFNLTGVDPGFDYQVPIGGLGGIRCDRYAVKISTVALDGTPGGCFLLTHLIFSGGQDKSFPIRGSLL